MRFKERPTGPVRIGLVVLLGPLVIVSVIVAWKPGIAVGLGLCVLALVLGVVDEIVVRRRRPTESD